MLRPRRLGQDATKLDTSVQLFGRKLGHAVVPVPGRGARGVSHRGRERRRQGGARAKDPPDPVEQQLAVVRSDRRGEGRAALVPDLHGPRLEHEQEADRPRRGCGLPGARLDDRSARREQSRALEALPRQPGVRPAALSELPQPQAGLPAADAPRARRSAGTPSAVHVGLRQAAQGRHEHEAASQGHRHARGGGAGG